ncbi:hydroxyisourate hydrolase [Acerihabitans sp. TG2]|uniref:hydroxyisourate hydrolase n=1 Tax=Acerihabitans sp. TG2 TaxID=3096008 RepID=UPI002B22B07F|nr:hydroxyisourate hydrolase [Acerihabitans sp. TG2]MEA9390161.1 hydroxyisourate hydrolase [Acerihabitans sp. TG2]
MSSLSTHILDTSLGKPATGISITLEHGINGHWQYIATHITNHEGRISAFTPDALTPGHYRLTADIGQWFAATGRQTLYVCAQIDVQLVDASHYHLPFLISPWSWSTYRGS